jgi:hypothetical protein
MTFPAALMGVAAGAILAGAVGYSVARFFASGLTRAETLAWSFATGVLVQATLFLMVVAVLPGRARLPLAAADVAIIAASFGMRRPAAFRPGRAWEAGPGERRPLVIALLTIAAAAFLLFLVSALSEPMWATDYLAMWGLKGKTIFETGFVPRRLFQDPALAWGRPDHPLLLPLSLAALASLSGVWNSQALALLFPLCELATILAAWGFLSRRVSALAGASAAALVSLSFPLYRAATAGLSEIPLALGLVLASCAFLDALESGSRSVRMRLFFASLLCAWLKPEGAVYVLLLAGILWVRHGGRPVETWKSGGWALVVPPVLQASLMFLLARPLPQHDFDPTFFEPRRWSELLARLGTVFARIFGTEVRHAWVPVLAIGLFLLLTRRGIANPLLAVLALQFLAYLGAFAISSHDPMWKVDSCFDRIVATLVPVFVLVLGARLGTDQSMPSAAAPAPIPADAVGSENV